MKKIIPALSILNVFVLSMCAPHVIPTEVNVHLNSVESFDIHDDSQRVLLEAEDPDELIASDIRYGRVSNSKPNFLRLTWTETNDTNLDADNYEVLISEDDSFTSPLRYIVNPKQIDIYNLKVNTKYYFRVGSIHYTSIFNSNVIDFTFSGTAPRNLFIEGVQNVRDLGGWTLDNGRVYKQGLIYRSAQFNYGGGLNTYESAPNQKGLDALLNDLRIVTDIDLRKTKAFNGDDEVNGITSSPLGRGVYYISAPMRFNNENIFTQDINKESIRLFFETLSDIRNYPMVFHCVRGTDRTGALAYVLGALVGMNKRQLMLDYLFSNLSNIGSPVYFNRISGEDFYVYGIDQSEGDTLSEKAKNYLINTCNVPASTIDAVINILS